MLSLKVFCVTEMTNQNCGHYVFSLYIAKHLRKGAPHENWVPERGLLEVKTSTQLNIDVSTSKQDVGNGKLQFGACDQLSRNRARWSGLWLEDNDAHIVLSGR